MFQLADKEWINLKSQNATSSWGGRRKLSYVFTEHGVLMLSSVLNSERSIAVNIHIMRVFIKLKEMLFTHKDVLIKMNELDAKVSNHDKSIKQVFAYLKQLIKDREEPRKPIGFKAGK